MTLTILFYSLRINAVFNPCCFSLCVCVNTFIQWKIKDKCVGFDVHTARWGKITFCVILRAITSSRIAGMSKDK